MNRKQLFKKIIFILLLVSVVVFSAGADDKNVFKSYNNALGCFFGPFTGTHTIKSSGTAFAIDIGIQYTAGSVLLFGTVIQNMHIHPIIQIILLHVDEFIYNIGAGIHYLLYAGFLR